MNTAKLFAATIALATSMHAAPALAGPYSAELGQCLVQSTTAPDRQLLVKWMFAMAGAHSDVKEISAVTPAMMDNLNKGTADLFMKLLTGSCRDKASKAAAMEGQAAFSAAFETLGQVAGKELFSDPAVTGNMSGMLKYIDGARLAPIFQGTSK